jgi:DNA polymerase-3 subunit epsilon
LKFVNARKVTEGIHLGPITSRSLATTTAEAIESVLPRFDREGDPANSVTVDWVLEALASAPESIAVLIDRRMSELAEEQRYEEAALTRDRLQAFVQCFTRQELADDLRRAGVLEVRIGDAVHTIDHGVLVQTRRDGELFSPAAASTAPSLVLDTLAHPEPPREIGAPVPTSAIDEVLLVARHLRTARGTIISSSGEWASRVHRIQDALGESSLSALRKSSAGSRGRTASDDVVTPLAKY